MNKKSFTRENPRHKTDFFVNKVIDDELHLARVRDISASGVFLYKLNEPQREADEVGIEIMLPGSDEVIWAAGKIVRAEERSGLSGTALNFTRISERHRLMISEFVERQRGKSINEYLTQL